MKILAIRVAECGRFTEPVALEGFSGGLDLLVGPNEAGKSTLVEALWTVISKRHRSTGRELEALRPYTGGAPMIEIDIETGGTRYRIRKRFLAERMAEIRSLTDGSVARGNDAEERIDALLGKDAGAGRFGLLWLKQGATLDKNQTPDATGEAALRAAITREVSSAAGGDLARTIRKKVLEALGEHVTGARRQPKGGYLKAIEAVTRGERDLDAARSERAEVDALLERLGALDGRARELVSATADAARVKRLAAAEAALATARDTLAAVDRARGVVGEARSRQNEADAVLDRLRGGLDEAARLEAAAREDVATTASDRQAGDEAAQRIEALDARRRKLAADVAEAERLHEVGLLRAEGAALQSRLSAAAALGDRVAALDAELRDLPSDERQLGEARRLARQIDGARARLEAAASLVTVRYAPGVAPVIRRDGDVVADGARLVASAEIVLDIPGVATIAVAPGAGAGLDGVREAVTRDEAALAAILAAARADGLDALEARFALARQLAAELAEARGRLDAVAPGGASGLAQQLRNVMARIAEIGGEGDEAGTTVGFDLDQLRTELRDVGEQLTVVRARHDDVVRRLALVEGRAAERSRRLAELSAALPPESERASRLASLDAAAKDASVAYDEAARALQAWSAKLEAGPTVAAAEAEVAAARAAIDAARQETAALDADRARIEGSLEVQHREDIEARVATLERALAEALGTRDRLAEEVQALQLLDAELAAEENALRAGFLAPVSERVAPFLDLVFPGAGLDLAEGFSVSGVRRGERTEALDRLSDGTKEQIAVLVRLGFARLLADRGLDVPLILDDALVYSDDRRIVAMHRALEAAAERHQVIVLTCREQSFAGLAGQRVALTPWRPDQA